MKKFLENFLLFQKAFMATRREAITSLCILVDAMADQEQRDIIAKNSVKLHKRFRRIA